NPHIELLKAEMPLKVELEDLVISGRIDDLLMVREDSKRILVEVKSTKSVDFQQKASHQHIMQLQFYMYATDVHSGIILYVDKSNLKTKAFEVEYNEETAKQITKRFQRLHECLKNNKLPPDEAKLAQELNWMCRYCEYKDKCDNNET
ncbi:PD-(D/E)XK nuclease family protein, partial [Candidatus Woesearchaeota archaeon]|nr:PD-(D/E)XK nuclease family protein [Candidatus Woesearchaeota archaeon]